MGECLIVYPGQSEPDALTQGRGEVGDTSGKTSRKTATK